MNALLTRAALAALLLGLLTVVPGAALRAQDVPPYDPKARPGDPPPVPSEEDLDVLGRGPVHEAFAQPPMPGKGSPGPVVPRQPPTAVSEVPPEEKPEGDNVVWVPGYWSWDEERKDFLWVSGFWRVAPPGRKWVPGYWARTDDGWRWVGGFWAPASVADLPYLNEPPDSLDTGPAFGPPDDGYFYVPGNWLPSTTGGFIWQPGYWATPRAGLVYNPARYLWTPGGYLFSSGYWDRPLAGRGVLLPPVAFNRPLYRRPGWSYRPGYAVVPSTMLSTLWVRPGRGSYYFGDYYNRRYARLGYRPWSSVGPSSNDPLYAYYHRSGPTWTRDLARLHEARVQGTAPLPPRTLAAQLALGSGSTAPRILTPLGSYRSTGLRMTSASAADLAQTRKTSAVFNSFGSDRRAGEGFPTLGTVRAPLSIAHLPPALPRVVTPGVPAGPSFSSLSTPRSLGVGPGGIPGPIVTGGRPMGMPRVMAGPAPVAAPRATMSYYGGGPAFAPRGGHAFAPAHGGGGHGGHHR